MKRNKVLSLVIAGALTTAVVGGTLAYFISKDSVTNSFTTAKTGIQVEEVFDDHSTGHTSNYIKVNIKGKLEHNKDYLVKITEVDGTTVYGEAIEK